jgi:hypothetical protein
MNNFSNNDKTIRCSMTEKSAADLRLLGKYSATVTFEPTRRGIWEVDSGGNLNIHPDTRFNEYNAQSLVGVFDYDEDNLQFDDLARGGFKVTQSPLVTFLNDGSFELTSRGILQSLDQSLQQPYNPEPIEEVEVTQTNEPTQELETPEPIEEVEVTQTNEPIQELETPEPIKEVEVTQTNEPIQELETPEPIKEVEVTQTNEPIQELETPEPIKEVEVTQTNEPTQELETPEPIEEVEVTQTNEPIQELETPEPIKEVEVTQTNEPIQELETPEPIKEVEVTQTNEPTQELETPEPIEEVEVTQTNEPTQELETPEPIKEVEVTQTNEPTQELDSPETSSEQTSTTLIQIQKNALLIRQSEKVNEKYDEILDLIDAKTAQQFANIPARFESDSSSSPNLDNNLGKKFLNSHEEKVSQTESFKNEVIESVEQEENKGKGWFQSFKDSLSSESIQNKLQSFKDNLATKTVNLGNKIASIPEEIATLAVMKKALDKIQEGRLLSSDEPQQVDPVTGAFETYQVGDYQVIATSDTTFSLLDNQGDFLMDFRADESLENPSLLSKSSKVDASQILKEIKDKPVQLNQEQSQKRDNLIQEVSQQMENLPKGRSVGENDQYIVRAYQGEKYLDDGFGHQITKDDISSLSYEDLESLSEQFEQKHQQLQAETAMPVFTKILKAHQSYEVNSNGSSLKYNLDDGTMTFTSSQGHTLKARSLGQGQWQHIEGKLSDDTISELKNKIEPQLDSYFESKAQKDQTREVLQTLG